MLEFLHLLLIYFLEIMPAVPPSLASKPSSRRPLILRQGRLPVMVVIILAILMVLVHLGHKEETTVMKKVVIIGMI
jgi:hypothetical protein